MPECRICRRTSLGRAETWEQAWTGRPICSNCASIRDQIQLFVTTVPRKKARILAYVFAMLEPWIGDLDAARIWRCVEELRGEDVIELLSNQTWQISPKGRRTPLLTHSARSIAAGERPLALEAR